MRVETDETRAREEEQARQLEQRRQTAVLDAMNRAARAGLGNRGRIRAGERALTKVNRQIEKEQRR